MEWENEKPVKNDKVILREIEGESLLVPIAQFDNPLLVLFALNKTGRFIWDRIESSCMCCEIVKKVMEKYDVEEKTAKADVEKFLSLLLDKNLISFNKIKNGKNV